MTIEFLGTGTSTGVPQIGCNCPVCTSKDPRDSRMRCSAIVDVDGKRILIDCGSDFRTQILQCDNKGLDALLVTHEHFDHVGGLDDLRPYCYPDPFPVYARQDVIDALKSRIPYCFGDHRYPGVPTFKLIPVYNEPFSFKGVEIMPISVWHGKLPIVGYRIKDLAYITDCKTLDDCEMEKLMGVKVLVVNALRYNEHPSHQTVGDALAIIDKVKPERAFIIHVSHKIGLHEQANAKLPQNVWLAYDRLKVDVNE